MKLEHCGEDDGSRHGLPKTTDFPFWSSVVNFEPWTEENNVLYELLVFLLFWKTEKKRENHDPAEESGSFQRNSTFYVCSSLYCHTEARSSWMKSERWFLFLLFFFQRRAGASLRAVRGCSRDLISKSRESSWRSTNGLKGHFEIVESRFETRWKWIRSLCWGEKTAIMGGKKDFTLNFQKQVLKFQETKKCTCVLCSALELIERIYFVSRGTFVVEFGVFWVWKKP